MPPPIIHRPPSRGAAALTAGLVGAVLLAAACSDGESPVGVQRIEPAILSASAVPNPHNVLSAVVAIETRSASRVRVEYATETGSAGATPSFDVREDLTELPVLGLLPDTDYELRVVAVSSTGDSMAGAPFAFRTGPLPGSLPSFEIAGTGVTEGGYTLLTVIPFTQTFTEHSTAVVIDAAGRVVWYRDAGTVIVDFQMQPNGHYTAAVARRVIAPYLDAVYEEWDVLGNTLHTWAIVGHEHTDFHEIRLIEGGREALLIGFVAATHDLTPFGGPPDGVVVGNVLQRVSRGGGLLFEWNTFDHYPLADADDYVWPNPNPAGYDHTHANAVELDRDGNYLLSTRHFSEVTKIDAVTGEILWRMGKGKGNQFMFLNDPHGGFSAMHSVRRLSNGNLLLIDNGNGHIPQASRAVEYRVDESARTAELVWSFEPGVFSCCMGYAQRLPGGNTLVNLGEDHRVFEVSPSGQVVWEARLSGGGAVFGIYRASRIFSLYGPP